MSGKENRIEKKEEGGGGEGGKKKNKGAKGKAAGGGGGAAKDVEDDFDFDAAIAEQEELNRKEAEANPHHLLPPPSLSAVAARKEREKLAAASEARERREREREKVPASAKARPLSFDEINASFNKFGEKGVEFRNAKSFTAAIEQYEKALALADEHIDKRTVNNCLVVADLCESLLGHCCYYAKPFSSAGYQKSEACFIRGRDLIRQLQSQPPVRKLKTSKKQIRQ